MVQVKPERPTDTARGTTNYVNKDDDQLMKEHEPRLHCLVCGFLNKESKTVCAVCLQRNWKGDFE